jgi:hypothetical protein
MCETIEFVCDDNGTIIGGPPSYGPYFVSVFLVACVLLCGFMGGIIQLCKTSPTPTTPTQNETLGEENTNPSPGEEENDKQVINDDSNIVLEDNNQVINDDTNIALEEFDSNIAHEDDK